MFGGPFHKRTHISEGFPQNRIRVSGPHIWTEDTIESMVGTTVALSTRTVKSATCLKASGLDTYSLGIESRKSIVDCRDF